MNIYYEFWSEALGLSLSELASPEAKSVTSGSYVEKHGNKHVFQFTDFKTGKKVLAASSLLKTVPSDMFLEFRDVDYGLTNTSDFKPVMLTANNLRLTNITEKDQATLDVFYQQCSEDDRDTLDLEFKNEFAVGIFENEKLLGVSRAAIIRKTPKLVDITVMLAPSARGWGLSTPLVSHLIEEIFARNLFPKYRVGEENYASIAVAERLGFKRMFQFYTWSHQT